MKILPVCALALFLTSGCNAIRYNVEYGFRGAFLGTRGAVTEIRSTHPLLGSMGTIAGIIDLPFSFVLDVVFLPINLPAMAIFGAAEAEFIPSE